MAELVEDRLEPLREQLRREAVDLCPDTARTALPPLRAVNHTIPLVDEAKILSRDVGGLPPLPMRCHY